MADLSEDLLSKFVRTYTKSFTLKEMKKVLSSLKIKATTQEIVEFLAENPNVLELANGSYITRAGAFTGEIFSIVPTASEVSQGVFVPGHRCMPFVEWFDPRPSPLPARRLCPWRYTAAGWPYSGQGKQRQNRRVPGRT